jgi:hypothetical protein
MRRPDRSRSYLLLNYNYDIRDKTIATTFHISGSPGTFSTRNTDPACSGAFVRLEFQNVSAGPYDSNDYGFSPKPPRFALRHFCLTRIATSEGAYCWGRGTASAMPDDTLLPPVRARSTARIRGPLAGTRLAGHSPSCRTISPIHRAALNQDPSGARVIGVA